MGTADANGNESGRHATRPARRIQAAGHPLLGEPQALGLPCLIAGSLAAGVVLLGRIPADPPGAILPISLAATSSGLFLATVWSACLGQTAVASVFGVLGAYWLSYATLLLGLTHRWFGIAARAVFETEQMFLGVWFIVLVLLTLAALGLPLLYTVLLLLADAADLLVFLGRENGAHRLLTAGGYVIIAFAAVGGYLFVNRTWRATGGPALPLGRPLLPGSSSRTGDGPRS